MEDFDHLKIQLKDIISATSNFVPHKQIGHGGFGSVYKGELSRPKPDGLTTVAFKRLNSKFGQGNVEFLKEIMMLSKCKHENLISLLHFCSEGDERILVYEYASRGSLDCYLSDPTLTWTQRLKICIGVARALNYLHHPTDNHQRILHRDIKSANILLDEEWNAKVSDFGLSTLGPANQPQTYLISNAVGTPGYCDPLYWETGILSKESDVYSFGVVLFEVMCGRSCCEYRDGQLLAIIVPMWRKCFEEKRLGDIVFQGIRESMESGSLTTFSAVAYRCLEKTREQRPTMAEIVQQLEMALEQQEVFADIEKRMKKIMSFEGMKKIADLAVSPLSYITQSQLFLLFMKGLLVDDGKTWFSVNKKGQHYELISATKCISTSHSVELARQTNFGSRFRHLLYYRSYEDLRVTVTTQFLSPNVTYIINLVYNVNWPHSDSLRIPFKYKLEETSQYSTSCVARIGEDKCRRTELFQFTSTKKDHHFDIQFSSEMKKSSSSINLCIQGIEFCPLDFENDENKVVDKQPATYNDMGKIQAQDYTSIVIKWSKDIEEESLTRKEVYFLLRKGLYINNSQQWFSISKKSKTRVMLPARAILPAEKSVWNFLSLPGSRFEEVAESCDNNYLSISFHIKTTIPLSITRYACYLVFKLPENNASVFEGLVIANVYINNPGRYVKKEEHHYIYLVTPPHTPIIGESHGERPSRTRKIKGHPKLRKDGWMEIQLGELFDVCWYSNNTVDGYLKSLNGWNFTGLLVQGIELRPAKVSCDKVRKIVSEADGYHPCLLAIKQGYRRLIDLDISRGPAEASVDAVEATEVAKYEAELHEYRHVVNALWKNPKAWLDFTNPTFVKGLSEEVVLSSAHVLSLIAVGEGTLFFGLFDT
ncbi:hypothetical protein SSX86_006020 [Deinandra increscens subsp. villosa]|uniref:non-specific serine/threonine protein kinase n=1 Tax=Deinandra increscens subsp. villosa TaxID=3103831 RepID=A0AAP0H7E3_9ASTR